MSIDIDSSRTCTRGIVAMGMIIIINEGNDDTSITSLVLDILHIHPIWERCHTTTRTRVLVFRLVENYWTTIGDLGFGDSRSNMGHVARWVNKHRQSP